MRLFGMGEIAGDFAKDLEVLADGEAKELVKEFADVFGPIPLSGTVKKLVTLDLELKPECAGAGLRSRPYPLTAEAARVIEEQAAAQVANGMADEYVGTETPKYCSPAFTVAKKQEDGSVVHNRMVVDYKRLNAITKPHSGSMPSIDAILERLVAHTYRSKVDMRSGFWQIAVTERAADLMAYITPKGRVYKPRVMQFGIKQAPPLFQELMAKVVARVKAYPEVRRMVDAGDCDVEVFIDDFGFGTATAEQHWQVLRRFFEVCRDWHLRCRLPKCLFGVAAMELLGFWLGEDGTWSPLKSKVSAMVAAKPPNTVQEVRSWLGALNFYRRHIHNFTHSSALLSGLTRKGEVWKWENAT
jgi:hypothetical protein